MKWLIVFGSAALFITADAIAYKWSKGGPWWLLLIVMVLGAIGYAGFAVICKFVPLGSTPMIGILVAVGAVIVGYLVFEEGLNWQQKVGIGFALLAFIFLNMHPPKLPPAPLPGQTAKP